MLADKSASSSGVRNENMINQESAKELRKPIIREFKKRQLYSSFKGNIWGVDLADKQLIS